MARSRSPDGFDLTINVPNTFPEIGKAVLNARPNLEAIGVSLEVREVPEEVWVNEYYGHDADIPLLASVQVCASLPDPSSILGQTLSSAQARPGGVNAASFVDPTVDRLLASAAASTDDAQRARDLMEVTRIAADQLPYFLFFVTALPVALAREYVWLPESRTRYAFTRPWLNDIKAAA